MTSSAETAIIIIVSILLFLAVIYWMYWLSVQLKMSFIVVFIISIFTGGIGLLALTIMALLPENKKQRAESKKLKEEAKKSPTRSPRKSPTRSPRRKSPSKK